MEPKDDIHVRQAALLQCLRHIQKQTQQNFVILLELALD
jgi:hypothetical protein